MKASKYHFLLCIICAIASAVFLYLGTTDTSVFCFILTVYNGLKSDIYEIEENLNKEADEN